MSSIVFACLVDKGMVEYGKKVSEYWPEFARSGKSEVRVEDVLRHESGLARWRGKVSREDVRTENIKANAVGKVVEEESLSFPDEKLGSRREYHDVTRGLILNEIFRRVEPGGRTIGEYLDEEIRGPLGVDVYMGADKAPRKPCQLSSLSFGKILGYSAVPRFASRKVEASLVDIVKMGVSVSNMMKSPDGRTPYVIDIPQEAEGMGISETFVAGAK